ncbi:MAG TPA: hypothetical protein DDX71_00780 [Ruminococcus sp.]|nr:hypothetical protein [Ruminococcus sp.]
MEVTLSESKASLGQLVYYRNERLLICGAFTLSALIIRKSERGEMIVQAELTKGKTVLIAALSDIQNYGVRMVYDGRC